MNPPLLMPDGDDGYHVYVENTRLVGHLRPRLSPAGLATMWYPSLMDGEEMKPRRRRVDAIGAVLHAWKQVQ